MNKGLFLSLCFVGMVYAPMVGAQTTSHHHGAVPAPRPVVAGAPRSDANAAAAAEHQAVQAAQTTLQTAFSDPRHLAAAGPAIVNLFNGGIETDRTLHVSTEEQLRRVRENLAALRHAVRRVEVIRLQEANDRANGVPTTSTPSVTFDETPCPPEDLALLSHTVSGNTVRFSNNCIDLNGRIDGRIANSPLAHEVHEQIVPRLTVVEQCERTPENCPLHPGGAAPSASAPAVAQSNSVHLTIGAQASISTPGFESFCPSVGILFASRQSTWGAYVNGYGPCYQMLDSYPGHLLGGGAQVGALAWLNHDHLFALQFGVGFNLASEDGHNGTVSVHGLIVREGDLFAGVRFQPFPQLAVIAGFAAGYSSVTIPTAPTQLQTDSSGGIWASVVGGGLLRIEGVIPLL